MESAVFPTLLSEKEVEEKEEAAEENVGEGVF